MSKNAIRQNQPAVRHLHPTVYWAIIGLTLWYVVAVWFGFSGSNYADYVLMVVTLFILISVALPIVAWVIWRQNRDRGDTKTKGGSKHSETFSDWASAEIDVGPGGKVKGTTAAIEVLLPIAAVTFGMIAFAIITFLGG
jgi:hypothetical protein